MADSVEGTNRMEKLDMTNFGDNYSTWSVVMKATLDSKNVGKAVECNAEGGRGHCWLREGQAGPWPYISS